MEAQEARKSAATKASAPGSNSTDTKKFPTFKLQPFIDFEDNVEKFLETVHNNFTENRVISFLNNVSHATTYADTSKSYCLTLLKSLEDSIYEYLVGEYKDTFTNSALLWKKFKDVLTNNVTDMKVMDHYWLEMKKLQCNGVEEFEMFYNNFIIILNKLIKFNSIAATDNTFLRSIVFHKIDIPELAAEVSAIELNLISLFKIIIKLL